MPALFSSFIHDYRHCKRGVTGVEYGMIGALVSVAIISSVSLAGGSIQDTMRSLIAAMNGGDWLSSKGEISAASATGVYNQNEDFADPNKAGFVSTTSLENWEVTGAGTIDVWQNGMRGLFSPSGQDFIDLRANTDQNSGIKTTMDGLIRGDEYTVDLSVIDTARAGNALAGVYVGGERIGTLDPPNDGEFVDYQLRFVAGTGDGSNSLEIREEGTQDEWRGLIVDSAIKVSAAQNSGS